MDNHNHNWIEDGGVTSARGFRAGAVFAGIKRPGKGKRDIGLIHSERPCEAAATFSRSSVLSPSVIISRELVQGGGPLHGVVATSGSANCAVGEQGFIDGRETVALAGAATGAGDKGMLIATTGLIGVELPMSLLRTFIPQIELSDEGGAGFARAIMTTDTAPKEAALKVDLGGGETVALGGAATGSGMIHPDMATMLAFVTTDAAVTRDFLRAALSEAVGATFNQIDVDGDQSTNDIAAVLANGAAGNAPLNGEGEASERFRAGLHKVCEELAKMIVRDAEGGRHKLIEVEVDGAADDDSARRAARAIASSLLVKTAVYGQDPNWGRIMMALGKSRIKLEEGRIKILINDIQIVEEGRAIAFNAHSVVQSLGSDTVAIRVELGVGEGRGRAWGSELTEEYVIFNSAYTT